jgi:Tfp pilus assembly protein PilO
MTTKNKINLTLLVILAISVLLFVFLIKPIYINIQDNVQELISQREQLGALEDKIKNIEEFKKNYAQIEQNLDKGEDFFVNSEAPVNFINFLEKAGSDSQITIEIEPYSAVLQLGDEWLSNRFQIASLGNPSQILKFIEKIESGPYLVEVVDLTITSLGERDLKSKEFEGWPLGTVALSLNLKAFAQ